MRNKNLNASAKPSLNDPPNPHFLDYSDEQLRTYIAENPAGTGDFLLGAEAAQKELSRRQIARAAFLA